MNCIVLAWLECFMEPVPGTGRPDLGVIPKVEPVLVPKAIVWLARGDRADVEAARAYADENGYTLFLYEVDEEDPLGRARKDITAL